MVTSTEQSTGKTDLPLIRLSLLIPFVQELDKREVDVENILSKLNITRETLVLPEVFVPAAIMYELLESFAQSANDPYLAVSIGEKLDLYNWPLFTEAAANASTVGDFFLRFTMNVSAHATSVCMTLKTDGEYATFLVHRMFEPKILPAQADAFYVGLFSNIVQHAVGIQWDPRAVIIKVGDVNAVPKRYHDILLTEGDCKGPSIRFPMQWLLQDIEQVNAERKTREKSAFVSPPRSLLDSIRESLLSYIHLTDLTVQHAAELCGYKERTLRRKLKEEGTTLTREINRLRKKKAIKLLAETDNGIADIGASVGIGNPSVFTRSFRKWTGMSPKEYRDNHRKP